MNKLLEKILSSIAKIYIRKYRPFIIAVTGNVGKTSTKEAIAAVVRKVRTIRMNGGNLNNELGVPLTILGDWSDAYYRSGGSLWFWFRVLVKGVAGILVKIKYPETLVLEYGADRPGDIAKLAKNFKPDISVVTAVGEVPVHIEYFSSPREVAGEKSKLVEYLNDSDFAVLNHDDETVLAMKEKTKARVKTFGFTEGADLQISNFDIRTDTDGNPAGVSFKINKGMSFVPVKIDGSLGRSLAFSSGAAACVGEIIGMNLAHISEALSGFKGPKGRLRILRGIKDSIVIDDTYNASPASMHLALDTLKSFAGKRKIAVLGDMLELGEYSENVHRDIGNLVGSFVDVLVCVGPRAKFIADSARNQLVPASQAGMPKENIYTFDTSEEAKSKVQELIREHDLVLVKGSQGIRMEKITEEIMAEPEKKGELLVRQSKKWLSR